MRRSHYLLFSCFRLRLASTSFDGVLVVGWLCDVVTGCSDSLGRTGLVAGALFFPFVADCSDPDRCVLLVGLVGTRNFCALIGVLDCGVVGLRTGLDAEVCVSVAANVCSGCVCS